eukprot:gene6079-6693_t
MNKFNLAIKDLASFHQDQDAALNEKELEILGGLGSLEKKLFTNFSQGLTGDEQDLETRRQIFGRNDFPEPPSVTWLEFFLESFEDTTIIVLITAAVVSFLVGMYEDPSKGWIEGVAILSAVLIVAVVTATNNYNKELQFRKLNAVKDDVTVQTLRSAINVNVNVRDLVVGDIVLLNAGDRVPADGLLVDGSDVTVNESSLTGESEDKKKTHRSWGEGDQFLLSGTTLSTGYAKMLVTAVGEHSRWGKTRALMTTESSPTPLQEKLDTLANQIGHFGMAAAGLTFSAMIALWFLKPEWRDPEVNFYEFMLKAFIMAVTIVVVAVPEGLPLAVTLSLAFSTQKMMRDNNLIRVLAACETMGNATNICSDKTGTLTQNRMSVVAGWLAGQFHNTLTSSEICGSLDQRVVDFICEGVAVNSTASISSAEGDLTVTGNKTEGALLIFIKQFLGADYLKLRSHFSPNRGDRLITFSSARKRMSVVLCDERGGVCYTKGASEIILSRCSKISLASGEEVELSEARRREIIEVIDQMAKGALRTVALAHRALPQLLSSESDPEELECELVLDAILGIKDPLRPDVPEAVRQCQQAGIFVRMVTGDNIETAKAIAKECGILTEGGLAMEGPDFRRLTPRQLDEILPRLQVLARSSPDDKHTLVTRLNGKNLPETPEAWQAMHPDRNFLEEHDKLLPGYREEWIKSHDERGLVAEVVGVTGDGTNDGPALKAGDVGLSMGLSGTEVAKEASDIVILDDNFSSIVKSVMWGRAVFDNIRKFLQFQLTVNAVALTVTFLSALAGKEPPLNAVMMLWVNLIMDTLGALALGTEPPSATLLQRKPYRRTASLISRKMTRNILIQFFFQMTVLGYVLLAGAAHFNVVPQSREHLTVVFNTFVLCQLFNEINARSIGNEVNVFHNLHRNPLFIAILLFTAVAQFLIVEFGGDFVRTTPLSVQQWKQCVALAAFSLPLGGLMRCLPASEREDDFAPLAPLMRASYEKEKEKQNVSEKREGQDGSLSLSFMFWVAVVGLVPLLAWQQFADHWSPLLF